MKAAASSFLRAPSWRSQE